MTIPISRPSRRSSRPSHRTLPRPRTAFIYFTPLVVGALAAMASLAACADATNGHPQTRAAKAIVLPVSVSPPATEGPSTKLRSVNAPIDPAPEDTALADTPGSPFSPVPQLGDLLRCRLKFVQYYSESGALLAYAYLDDGVEYEYRVLVRYKEAAPDLVIEFSSPFLYRFPLDQVRRNYIVVRDPDMDGLNGNRDRGEPHGSTPPTPPCVRVRTRRFGRLSALSDS